MSVFPSILRLWEMPVRLRTLKPKGETRGFLYTVLVLLIFLASYLHVVIRAVLALHSSHTHDFQSAAYCAVRTACVYICIHMYVYVCICFFLILNVLIFQIFENGKDTGEISVCISKKDLEPNSPTQAGCMMERVSLLTFHL